MRKSLMTTSHPDPSSSVNVNSRVKKRTLQLTPMFVQYGGPAHPLIAAAHDAHTWNVPLELGPDLFYNIILQGIAQHVQMNPERYRRHFVKRNADFKQPYPGWDGVREGMMNLLTDMGNQMLNTSFSTTRKAESTSNLIMMMNVIKAHVSYEFLNDTSVCSESIVEAGVRCGKVDIACMGRPGIPSLDFTGTQNDWTQMLQVVSDTLSVLMLDEWRTKLQAILREIVSVVSGAKTNPAFWENFCTFRNADSGRGHGQIRVFGWVTHLFPHASVPAKPGSMLLDPMYLHPSMLSRVSCISDFPSGLRAVPVSFLGDEIVIRSGVIGVIATGNGTLRIPLGWVIEDHATS